MAKKPNGMEIADFKKRLDASDELTKELLLAIHGDPDINVEGLVPLVKRLDATITSAMKKVLDLERWKEITEENKGTISIKRSVLFTRVLAIAGAVGILVSALIGITQVIDWLVKQGILTP